MSSLRLHFLQVHLIKNEKKIKQNKVVDLNKKKIRIIIKVIRRKEDGKILIPNHKNKKDLL
jgi:hypothetical protein